MTLQLSVYYQTRVAALLRLGQAKKDLGKAVFCHKMSSDSHSTRKHSIYEYYDDELDVTFISSEGEFNLGENTM
jgi:hypothetical protein